MPLEKENDNLIKQKGTSTFSMQDVLGQFIRFLHLILICSLQEEGKKANLYPTNPQLANLDHSINSNKFFDR